MNNHLTRHFQYLMNFTCRLYVKLLEELSRSMIKACIFIKIFEQNYCGKNIC